MAHRSAGAPGGHDAPGAQGALPVPGAGVPGLDALLEHAVRIPSPTIHAHVQRLRERNPEASPERLLALLEKEYLTLVQSTGAAVGAAAAIPAVGTATATALTVGDLGAFFAASAAYTLAVADVHGIAVEDTQRRRALLLASVLGDDGTRALASAGINPASWGKVLLAGAPSSTIRKVNKVLTGRFLKRYLAKQSGVMLGRLIPFGVGAAVGALGGRALGRGVVRQAHAAFGPPPVEIGVPVRVVEATSPTDTPVLLERGTDLR